MDSNKTRVRQKKEEAKNLSAFLEIIGDPYRDIDGVYNTLHNRSSMGSIEDKLGQPVENISAAKPSLSDFFCDVENAVKDVIPSNYLEDFFSAYFDGNGWIHKHIRKQFEQSLGKVLRSRGIYPVKRYFTVNTRK